MKVEIQWFSVGKEGVLSAPVVARSWSDLSRLVGSYIPGAGLTVGGWIEKGGERVGVVRDSIGCRVCAPSPL